MEGRSRIGLTLASAQGVSTLGSQVSVLALPTLAVTHIDAGPVGFSAITIAAALPVIALAGPIGRFVGHRAPRWTMVGADVVRAGIMSIVPLMLILHIAGLWVILAVAGVAAVFTAAFDVASQSYVAITSEESERAGMNSAVAAGQSVGQTIGPAVGGMLIAAFGPAQAVVADVATFVVSAILLCTLPRTRHIPSGPALATAERADAPDDRRPPPRRSTTSGWSILRRHPGILRVSLAGAALNLGGSGLGAIFILYAYTTLHISSVTVGLLYSAYGGSSLVGGLLGGRIIRRLGCDAVTRVAGLIAAASLILIPAASVVAPAIVLTVYELLFGFSATVWSVSFVTLRQNSLALGELSLVNSVVRSLLVCTFPVGAVAAGTLASAYGMHVATLALAIVAIASCGWYVRSPSPSVEVAS